MVIPPEYLQFIEKHGLPMSSINPGSNEYALNLSDARHALALLKGSHVAICGGDVLEESGGALEYCYDNWYCDQKAGENPIAYVERSHNESIMFLNKLAERNNSLLYVVLVLSELGVV